MAENLKNCTKNNQTSKYLKKQFDKTWFFWFNSGSNDYGAIAQSVEQRIENPCVGSSILPHATIILQFENYSLKKLVD